MNLRWLSVLSVTYVALIVYASLMPFDLSAGASDVRDHMDRAWQCWPFARVHHTSRTDLLSNFVLYVPLGAMLATRWAGGGQARVLLAILGATMVGSAVSAGVEFGQLFSFQRISSAQDWVMNTAGSGLGAFWGAAAGRRAWASLSNLYRRWRAQRPTALLAAGLCILLAGDALSPYLPTIDVSQVKRNLRHSNLRLVRGLEEHPWHHWAVNRLGVYAVLSALIGASMRSSRKDNPDSQTPPVDRSGPARWVNAVIYTTVFAAACEAAKPFIVARNANIANVAASAAGAILGAILGAAASGRLPRRGRIILAELLLLAFLAYQQWSPFDFAWNVEAMRSKVPMGVKWLPLYYYAMGGRLVDVGLFLRTILLSAAVTYTACLGGWWFGRPTPAAILRAALAAGLLGLILEGGQFLLPSRVPSVTDVFCFAVGGAMGCWAYLSARKSCPVQPPAVSCR